MDGVHDLGGRAGLGPINPEPNEPVFHSDWERSVLVMFPAMAIAGAFNLDEFRAGMEQIPPVEYLSARYYEHWMHSMEIYGTRAGIWDDDELERRTRHYLENPDEPAPKSSNPEMVELLRGLIPGGDNFRRESASPPKFNVGDRVQVRPEASTTHTRRAGYVRGRTGEVALWHGSWVFPDTNAIGQGEGAEHVYTVKFAATELWGELPPGETSNTYVYIDVWEPYLTSV